MENWRLIPFKSVGPIDFNNTKEDVIKKLGEPEYITKNGEFLTYEDFSICLSEKEEIEDFRVGAVKNITILYEGLILNVLDYKQIVKELFRKGHEIYGDYSSFPMYVDKDIGVGFVTHESNTDDTIELEGLQILSREAMPDFNDKKLCPDDILITNEKQII